MTDGFFEGPTLAIETSCDETSCAVVRGQQVLASVVSSQVDLHRQWGGVVPEAAARAHVEALLPVVELALAQAGLTFEGVAAIAVTNRPGLVGALSVGVTAAKALAWSLELPLVGVHHLEGHVLSPFANGHHDPNFPHLCLLVSGGHTELILVQELGVYRLLGQTLDDAAGEAFDKTARLVGLPYPGGQAIQEAARLGNSQAFDLPRGLRGDTRDFSFSGLKTAARRIVEANPQVSVADLAASLQEAIVSVLSDRAVEACHDLGVMELTLAGGVAANEALRQRLRGLCEKRGFCFTPADLQYCTDNAAMIGLAGNARLARGEHDGPDLDVWPSAPLP